MSRGLRTGRCMVSCLFALLLISCSLLILTPYSRDVMTSVEVMFRYALAPGETEMAAMGQFNDVYGIRRVRMNEKQKTILIEYDATRLTDTSVEKLLRSAGIDIREKLALA